MRSDVTVADIDQLVGSASIVLSKLQAAKLMMVRDQLPSAFLHHKEIKRYIEKAVIVAEQWSAEIREQCDAHRQGITSAHERLRRRYNQPSRRGSQSKPQTDDRK